MSRNNNRLLQYEAFRKRRVEVARFIVSQKLKEIERFFRIDLRGELKALERAKDIDSLMGVEGNASKKMFDRFKENVGGCGFEFYGRSYRPPADPVNALLSLAYTFAYYLAFPIVSFLGYDPYISFLHSKRGTHASFCSDVVEFVRPLLTKHLEDVLLREVFKKEDFKRQGNGFLVLSSLREVMEENIEPYRTPTECLNLCLSYLMSSRRTNLLLGKGLADIRSLLLKDSDLSKAHGGLSAYSRKL